MPEPIRLDQFLKVQNVVASGGQAKVMIQGGEVKVNGQTETRRSRKLKQGDIVEVLNERMEVIFDPD